MGGLNTLIQYSVEALCWLAIYSGVCWIFTLAVSLSFDLSLALTNSLVKSFTYMVS